MLQITKLLNTYFILLFSIIPISIFLGSTVSLVNLSLILIGLFLLYEIRLLVFSLKDRALLSLIILYLYLISNSFFSLNFEIGFLRNFGFIRFILLFLVINLLFYKKFEFKKVFKFWLIIFSIFIFDIIFEFYNGHNIFGFESENKKRIVSFFKDEQVVGAFLNGFGFILIGYLFNRYEKFSNKQKIFLFLFLITFVSSMIFSGERSNTIKLIIGLMIFFYLNDKIHLKQKLFFLFSLILIFTLTFLNVSEIKHRYGKDLINQVKDKEKRERILYFQLYKSAFAIFKEYPITGVGNKNYRVVSCGGTYELACSTHPHQIYFEFLSEHGILGTLILLSIIFYLIFRNYSKMLLKRNLLQISCFCYLIVNFIPILPGGSFFADFNATFFWINFSIFYASNFHTNIFSDFKIK
tara:strand:- start:5698 stop:6927 length:1230 start_codon:yes stop_codon:yes gene_type:complete